MNQLLQMYQDIDSNEIRLFMHEIEFTDAATIEFNQRYAIFLDCNWFESIADMKSALAHEIGHCLTGCTHKSISPIDLIQKHEYKANRWAVEQYLPYEKISSAINAGYTEPWQIAERFNISEEMVVWAISYYTEACGLTFEKSE